MSNHAVAITTAAAENLTPPARIQAVDAGTQTDMQNPPRRDVSLIAPNLGISPSQLSVLHSEDAKQTPRPQSKRMSAIIVTKLGSRSSADNGSLDDTSVLSIQMPNRYSVSSFKSIRSPDGQRRDRAGVRGNSFIISDGDPDNTIAIDLLSSSPPDAPAESSDAAHFEEIEETEAKSLDDFVPAPAYEEVAKTQVVPTSSPTLRPQPVAPPRTSSEPALLSNQTANSSESTDVSSGSLPQIVMEDDLDVEAESGGLATTLMRKTLGSLPKLPPLAASDYITDEETSKAIQDLSSSWPVLKSGLLLRKKVPSGSGSSTSLQLRTVDRGLTSRALGRSLGNFLKGKRRPRNLLESTQDPRSTNLGEEDEWNLLFGEVRGRYLMFYVLHDPLRQGAPSFGSPLARHASSLSGTGRDSVMAKPFARIFNSLGKKSSRASHLRKTSDSNAQMQTSDGRPSLDDMRRASNDQHRNILANMNTEELRTAPRTLVHYLPLHKSMVETSNASALVNLSKAGYSHSYASTGSVNANSMLVLSTTPIDRQHGIGPISVCDQILLDVLLHEDLAMDATNELTVSTTQSIYRESQSRQKEIAEWAAAMRAVTDLTSGALPTERTVSPLGTSGRQGSPHGARSPEPTTRVRHTSVQSGMYAGNIRAGELTEGNGLLVIDKSLAPSPPPKAESEKSSVSGSLGRSQGSLPRALMPTVSGPSDSSLSSNEQSDFKPTAPNPKSFTKMFTSRWKGAFEKELPRPKPVISGPTNFTKVEGAAEMLLQQRDRSQQPAPPPSAPTASAKKEDLDSFSDLRSKALPVTPPTALIAAAAAADEAPKTKKVIQKQRSHREASKESSLALRKDKDKKREAKERKGQKPSPLIVSAPVPLMGNTRSPSLPNVHMLESLGSEKPLPPQPIVASSRLFFPFFHKNLFAAKDKEAVIGISPVAERLQRSSTACSRTSTLRRRVGRARPDSSGTMASDKGTIGSGIREQDGHVPLILKKCIGLVDEIGLHTEGLYRISGSASTVDRLRRLLALDASRVHLHVSQVPPMSPLSPALSASVAAEVNAASEKSPQLTRRASGLSITGTSSSRSSVDLTLVPMEMKRGSRSRRASISSIPPGLAGLSGPSLYDNDVHVVTGVIKGFLRQGVGSTKEPLCSFDLYEAFIAATQISDWRARMITIQDIVHNLPLTLFSTLKFVCEHLYRVSLESDKNRMSIRNLSIIFGPTLLRPPPALDSMARIIEDMPFQCTLVETLIEQVDWVFGPVEFEEVEEEETASVVSARDGPSPENGELDDGHTSLRSDGDIDAGVATTMTAGISATSLETNTQKNDGELVADLGSNDGSNVGSNVGVVGDETPETQVHPRPPPVDDVPALSSSTTPPRARQSRNKMERRRGQLMPATYLSELRAVDGNLEAFASSRSLHSAATAAEASSFQHDGRPERENNFETPVPADGHVDEFSSVKTIPTAHPYHVPVSPALPLSPSARTRSASTSLGYSSTSALPPRPSSPSIGSKGSSSDSLATPALPPPRLSLNFDEAENSFLGQLLD
ncbi:hypothetical protein HKX48_000076 [Thoreauomyces humboldtii]|nr:hypothetical protein HKX48_000076 [Thoreauomyces humboldtii]